MLTVLVVEDDAPARMLAVESLAREQYRILEAGDATRATELLAEETIDLVVLDLGLPDRSGLDLIDTARERDAAVVIVTGRGELEDRIVGLRMGADDYLVKPIEPGELNARVEAVLRRRWPHEQRRVLQYGPLSIDRAARAVLVDESPVELTPIEFDLLAFLADRPRRAYTREELLERVWDSSSSWQVVSTVTEHVRKLRRKLREVAEKDWITTVRGVGYRFDP